MSPNMMPHLDPIKVKFFYISHAQQSHPKPKTALHKEPLWVTNIDTTRRQY